MTIIDAARQGGRWRRLAWINDRWGHRLFEPHTSGWITTEDILADDWEPVPEEPPQWCKDAAERYYRPCFPRAKPHDVLELAEIIAEEWREAGKP